MFVLKGAICVTYVCFKCELICLCLCVSIYLSFRLLVRLVTPDVMALVNSITRGADKSLARPTSRSRGTESIVSLERGVCSCAELQVFSCYGG